MAIPGRNFESVVEVRGKVRHGIKAANAKGVEYPKAVEYWVSQDAEVEALGQVDTLRITFPYATAEECFSSGLEWWKGSMLACYTKDGGPHPVALRIATLVDADDETRGEPRGQNRQPITCRADACKHLGANAKNKECRPMGRLVFFLAGGREDEALQYDTKAWDTIRNIAKALTAAAKRGPLNAEGRVFELRVELVKKGRDTFPTCHLKEVEVPLTVEKNGVEKATALILIEGAGDKPAREVLAAVLDEIRPGWRQQESYVTRIKEVGAEAALKSIHAKLNAEAAA